MPYRVVKEDCQQADGASGSYALYKLNEDGSLGEQVSCHGSQEDAEASKRARYAGKDD